MRDQTLAMESQHIQLFNAVWIVDFVDKGDDGYDEYLMEDGELFYEGRCDHQAQRIVILNSLTSFRKKKTIVHELLHVILDMTGQKQNEHLIDALSTGIMDLLINDPFMVKFLSDTSDLRQAE